MNTDDNDKSFISAAWAQRRPVRAVFSVLFGSVITLDFFRRHALKLLLLLLLILIYISTQYQSKTYREDIKRLESELLIVRSERIRESIDYNSRTRESAMQQLADSILPGLAVQEQPPFSLPDNE